MLKMIKRIYTIIIVFFMLLFFSCKTLEDNEILKINKSKHTYHNNKSLFRKIYSSLHNKMINECLKKIRTNIDFNKYDTIFIIENFDATCSPCINGKIWSNLDLFYIKYENSINKYIVEYNEQLYSNSYSRTYFWTTEENFLYKSIEKWNIDTLKKHYKNCLGYGNSYVTRVIRNGKKLEIETEKF